jgi:hypothetical protein
MCQVVLAQADLAERRRSPVLSEARQARDETLALHDVEHLILVVNGAEMTA